MKILIFTVSSGNGHNSAAKTLKTKILKENPSAQVEIVDAYKSFAPSLASWKMEQGYFLACKYILGLYNAAFKQSEKNNPDTKFINNVHKEIRCFASGLLKKIYEFQPDIIISTYIFVAVALCDLKRVYNIPAKLVSLTLDYGISPYWDSCTDLDTMFVTGEYMVEPFKKLGFKKEQIVASGIAIDEKFSVEINKLDARKMLNLDLDLFTIIVMKGGFFTITNAKLMNAFAKINKPVQIVLINGKAEDSKKDLDNRIAKMKLPHKFVNVGFTTQVDIYLSAGDIVLGKAGGLSTTESINKTIPSIIVEKLPQQEIYNKDYLVENGCAIALSKKNTISNVINDLINNPEKCEELKNNNAKIKNSKTADIIYERLSSYPTADYSNIPEFKDSKFKLINKITSALRKEEKNRKLNAINSKSSKTRKFKKYNAG